ncbi:Uncharacterized protein AC505_4314 [Pseudomonas syringae pv. maculicola]|nr:Uncharacterized protein AC505_4314 [Pseudomonas syringae pv. maculicola]
MIVQHMNDYKKERDQLKAEAETLSETTMAQESMIEQLKEESFEGLYNAAIDERDQLKARGDALHRMLGLAWGSGDVSAEDCRKIDAALSNPAGSEPA